ncbi:class I SAM-dependent methyltransferase [Caulobacter sp. KR2-114]|uniref:class I SAM-dependent methyltransferase n=1 Tax=Caulobacter sp. KR2-114 TaxID=3400912 RepID=UPI003C023211
MSLDRRAVLAAGLALPTLAVAPRVLAQPIDPRLQAAIDDPRRKPADRARDAFRHPAQTLTFWGLKPGMTVIDVNPGTGWWTDILAPYLAATHGRYIAAGADLANPKLSDAARQGRAAFEAKYADKAVYGDVTVAGFGRVSGPLAPPGTVDLVIVSRETHNWADGFIQKAFADFHAALKPSGLMGVEDHRAPDGADPKAGTGYVSEAWVIDQAKMAGFRLDGRSEVNANPKDTKDHPFGVWTLPPTRQSAPNGQPANPAFDHSKYDAIGESDRMTLRFVRV